MASVLQPLRDEHRALLANIEDLRSVADVAGEVPGELLRQGLADACRFLVDLVIPQLEAEARAVFPRIVRLVGAAIVTAPMERDLAEIRRLTSVLHQLQDQEGEVTSGEHRKTLRRALYALSILIPLHFRKEEDLYFSILENALNSGEVQRLFQDMDTQRLLPAGPSATPEGGSQS